LPADIIPAAFAELEGIITDMLVDQYLHSAVSSADDSWLNCLANIIGVVSPLPVCQN